MKVSVIVTIKNEGEAIRLLLDSLLNQTMLPDEIVMCDGGSTDDTLAILDEYRRWLPLRVVSAPGSNISQGRNRAIEAAAGPIIAATDAGVVLSPVWLEQITRPIRDGRARVVSGWFEADPYTDFEVVMGATVLPDLADIEPRKFLPSSRSVAFLKEAWAEVGGYPEWLDYSEDLIFDLALRERTGPFPFVPQAAVYFRPRGDLKSFFRQYYLYARGDGKANLWPKRHAVRYLTYLLLVPSLLRLIWQGRMSVHSWRTWMGGLGLLFGLVAYCRRPGQRLWRATYQWALWPRLRAFGLLPIIRVVGDVAKMVGYPAGVYWRLRHRHDV